MSEDDEDADLYLKILPFLLSDDNATRSLPSILVPLMRLLSALHDPRYGGGGLAEIDAVIGAPLLLPAHQMTYNFQYWNDSTKRVVVESTFHAVNWLRELLNSFVHDAAFPNHSMTQGMMSEQVLDNNEIKTKIAQRLSTLVDLESDLGFMASNCETFCPPNGASLASAGLTSCLEDEGGGVGGGERVRVGSVALPLKPNCEDLSTEEKKVALDAWREQTKIVNAQNRKIKMTYDKFVKKRDNEKTKLEGFLRNRTMKSLRTLSPDVVLALGFPSMKAVR